MTEFVHPPVEDRPPRHTVRDFSSVQERRRTPETGTVSPLSVVPPSGRRRPVYRRLFGSDTLYSNPLAEGLLRDRRHSPHPRHEHTHAFDGRPEKTTSDRGRTFGTPGSDTSVQAPLRTEERGRTQVVGPPKTTSVSTWSLRQR